MVNVKSPIGRLLFSLWWFHFCLGLGFKPEKCLAVPIICKHTSPSTFMVLQIPCSPPDFNSRRSRRGRARRRHAWMACVISLKSYFSQLMVFTDNFTALLWASPCPWASVHMSVISLSQSNRTGSSECRLPYLKSSSLSFFECNSWKYI